MARSSGGKTDKMRSSELSFPGGRVWTKADEWKLSVTKVLEEDEVSEGFFG